MTRGSSRISNDPAHIGDSFILHDRTLSIHQAIFHGSTKSFWTLLRLFWWLLRKECTIFWSLSNTNGHQARRPESDQPIPRNDIEAWDNHPIGKSLKPTRIQWNEKGFCTLLRWSRHRVWNNDPSVRPQSHHFWKGRVNEVLFDVPPTIFVSLLFLRHENLTADFPSADYSWMYIQLKWFHVCSVINYLYI